MCRWLLTLHTPNTRHQKMAFARNLHPYFIDLQPLSTACSACASVWYRVHLGDHCHDLHDHRLTQNNINATPTQNFSEHVPA